MRIKNFKLFLESLNFNDDEIDNLAKILTTQDSKELGLTLLKSGLGDSSQELLQKVAEAISNNLKLSELTDMNQLVETTASTLLGQKEDALVYDPFEKYIHTKNWDKFDSNYHFGSFIVIFFESLYLVRFLVPTLIDNKIDLTFKHKQTSRKVTMNSTTEEIIDMLNYYIKDWNQEIQSDEFKAHLYKYLKDNLISKHKTQKLVTVEDLENLGVTENTGQIMGQFFKQYASQMNELRKLDYSEGREKALELLSNFVDTL